MFWLINGVYLIAAVLFILGLKAMSSPKTAKRGITWAGVGMLLATVATFFIPADGGGLLFFAPGKTINLILCLVALAIGAGLAAYLGKVVKMTDMPQMVAIYNGMGGGAAALIAAVEFTSAEPPTGLHAVLAMLGAFIGSVAFSGSILAWAKLQGVMKKAVRWPVQNLGNVVHTLITLALGIAIVVVGPHPVLVVAFFAMSLILGLALTSPIGGADMPVVVSMLNSYSGWAAAGIGFSLNNSMLIIAGSLVGSSGAILSYIMCRAMNRSFFNVILGGFGGEVAGPAASAQQRPVKSGSPDDAAFLLANAESVIIVPGYGLAVARAQHPLKELADKLRAKGINVRYAIHPVAGRMPGHMNVLLAEAEVPYDQVFEMEDINPEFADTDVALILGANDVVNPAAKDPKSPIAGMPILEAYKARQVIVNKRSMASGYAGLDNELFYMDKTMMVFGDAKKVIEEIGKAV